MSTQESGKTPGGGPVPPSTRWSRIRSLDYDHLVKRYWRPIHRFVVSRGFPADEAEDLVQEVFLRLVEDRVLQKADQAKGSFRALLFQIVRRMLVDRHRERSAKKRDSSREIPLDPGVDPGSEELSPQAAFDEEWFRSLVNRARRRFKKECAENGKMQTYQAFRLFFFGDEGPERPSQQEIARRLGLTPELVKKYVHRAKERFSRQIRRAIGEYAGNDAEVEGEIRAFADLLAARPFHGLPLSSLFSIEDRQARPLP